MLNLKLFKTSYYLAAIPLLAFLIFNYSCDVHIPDIPVNPVETDQDLLHTPNIVQIVKDKNEDIEITLDFGYSNESTVILERRAIGGFSQVNYKKLNQTTLVDTTLDKETEASYIYRTIVKKKIGDKSGMTDYSPEYPFSYKSMVLNEPAGFTASPLESQGIQLTWIDKSSQEEGYLIEKNSGSGYSELANLPSNSQNYFDHISELPVTPTQLAYRIKAYKSGRNSIWKESEVTYTSIFAPTNLVITDTVPSHFRIEWQDNSSVETSYAIERKKNNESFQQIAEKPANNNNFVDNLIEKATFTYRVKAKKDNYSSLYSNEVTHTIVNPVPAEIIAYYPFTGNANDSSGNNNNGNIIGAVKSEDRFGNSNSAYTFDGNDYIDLLNRNLITGKFSISVWIRPTSIESTTENFNTIINKWTLSLPFNFSGWYLGINSFYNIRMSIADGTNFIRLNGGSLEVNKWTHIVVTYDMNALKIYQNAVQVSVQPTNLAIGSNSNNAFIGLETDNNSSGFIGSLDDIRIYNQALSQQDIDKLFHERGWNGN